MSEAHKAVLAQQVEARATREAELSEQLVSYADRFGEFQGMIMQSNEAFATFKKVGPAGLCWPSHPTQQSL
jgi:hypothetical protein